MRVIQPHTPMTRAELRHATFAGATMTRANLHAANLEGYVPNRDQAPPQELERLAAWAE